MTGVSPSISEGLAIYTTGPSEQVILNGGHFNGESSLDTNNSVINGATFNGPYGTVSLAGANNVVQNSVFNGPLSNYQANLLGAIADSGTNNTIRFNVVNEPSSGAALSIASPTTATNLYGNIITSTQNPGGALGIGLVNLAGAQLSSNYNLFLPGMSFLSGSPAVVITAAQWQQMGYDVNSLFTGATFNNSTAGDFSLKSNSAGLGLVPASLLDPHALTG